MDILLDFDGTCLTHKYPQLGRSVGAEPVLKALTKKGHNLILFTKPPQESPYHLGFRQGMN